VTQPLSARSKSVLQSYREMVLPKASGYDFAADVVQAAEGLIAGEKVVSAQPEAFALAERIAVWELQAENRRLRETLEQLRHLVVSPGDMGREEIRAAGRRVIEEALDV
jgi:hypothetical protein